MRATIRDIQRLKAEKHRFAMLTAYDATMARLVEAAGIPIILVGDSLGMVVQGHETTVPVTLEQMIYHTQMVVRGTRKALIVADMPFGTYQASPEQAFLNAARLLREGGAGAVKLEGSQVLAPTVAHLTANGIPVMAHIGLTPQHVHQMGGWRVQGRDLAAARALVAAARAHEASGAFAVVLEGVPAALAAHITARLDIPTIGIGAGPSCDGQVQVLHDLLGLIEDFTPKHARQYAELGAAIREAVARYSADVAAGSFPTEAHSFSMDESILAQLD